MIGLSPIGRGWLDWLVGVFKGRNSVLFTKHRFAAQTAIRQYDWN